MANILEPSENPSSAFAKIDPNWKKWVIDAIKMGCTTESMVESMLKNGPFSETLAKNIIKEGRCRLKPELKREVVSEYPRPDINSHGNYIDLDRRITILMAMTTPRIVVMDNLLSTEECESLIAYAEQHTLARSNAGYVNLTGEESVIRTSSEVVFQHAESELIATIENRISVLTNWAAEKSEGIKVLRYEAGEFFMPHIDCYRPGSPVYQKMIAQGGQRVATLILYLSDVEKGGCTFFPKQEMEIRPHRGMGIFFVNIEKDGQPDLLTYHSGEPVISGVKWIATKWLRAESFNPPLETQTE